MKRFLLLLAVVLPLLTAGASAAKPSLSGTWTFDPARSTNLAAWHSFQLTIQEEGDHISLQRRLGWGRRVHEETMRLPLNGTATVVPVPYWADNRHLGAYISDERQKTSRARLIDHGRVLRVESDLTVETQQGPRDVNILSDYQLSPDGQTLTLMEIRSTRSRPVITVFRRAQS